MTPRRMSLRLAVCLFALIVASSAHGNVRLPAIFSDHMVFQQQQPIQIWGWAEPQESVSVTFGGQHASTQAAEDGTWNVSLPAMNASQSVGPFDLVVSGNVTVTVRDILIGEVWVCSGQSNMAWSVRRSENADQEIAAADYPHLRLFTVTRRIAEQPLEDCVGRWSVCNPTTVENFSAVAYFFGRDLHREMGVPIGLINTSWGGTRCEAWTPREGLEGVEQFAPILERSATFNPKTPHQASVLYNGMIQPLIPLGIGGAIWYQGESNVSRAQQYKTLFPTMITQWRQMWGQGDFPFYFVQLAPFRYKNQDPRNCAELWEAQFKTLDLPNTGMAVTTDIGNVSDIHPKNKQDVGKRLALWALANAYGKDLVCSGPLYDSITIQDGKARIGFKYVGGGLTTNDDQPLNEFTIAGDDEQFHPARAIIEGDEVVIHSENVPSPVAVRFAWHDTAQPNLINKEGLPASPFRTDDFQMATHGNR